MLKNTQVIFQIKRKPSLTMYIDTYELHDLILNLNQAELLLYNHLASSPLRNPNVEDFTTKALSAALSLPESAIKKQEPT